MPAIPTRPLLFGTFASSHAIVSYVSVLSSIAFVSFASRGWRSMTNAPSDLKRPRMSCCTMT
ncbi:MAG: hypothetical protein AUF76_02180 [Acidobacteria bacterium 13_1_20CM_2_65_9]|nr:MAG: hypothetical protein AUF76_02180 [Acidobacteria bacterium 13_1_20CM_2_65_9]